jgi:small subunit ribosomal protein S11
MDGNTVAWSSSGSIGYKGSKKGTPYAAQLAAADATRKAQNMGLSQLDIVIRGTGSGREQAIRSIQGTGVNVRTIIDDTPSPAQRVPPAQAQAALIGRKETAWVDTEVRSSRSAGAKA